MTAPYPLTFRPVLLPKAWGGRRLERFGKRLPASEAVGESWELADLDATSPDGAGGGPARSVVARGALAGRTLREALLLLGDAGTGTLRPAPDGGFPLLVKLLDAEQDLSVQVHPTPAYAAAHPGAAIKDETWYVLEANPGAVLYKGLKSGVSLETFERAVRAGDAVGCLEAVPAVRGECHHLPSGTVHALGGGIAVAEVQTPSDTTFRIWDWPDRYDRPGRELHVDRALASCLDGPAPATTRLPRDARSGRLADAGAYDLWEVRVDPGATVRHPRPGAACTVLLVLEGVLEWVGDAGRGAPDRLAVGGTVLVPPACAGGIRAVGAARVLAIGFPRAS